MDKIYKKYQGHTIENWISETSPDFKKFAGYVKRRMKIAALKHIFVWTHMYMIQKGNAEVTITQRYFQVA